MKRISLSDYNLDEIRDELEKGGLVIAPSDTVYGLLVDATNQKGVEKLIQFKNRPPGKPISAFVSGWEMLENVVVIDKKKESLLTELLPGPFTIILQSKHVVSKLLESEKGTLGVRYPRYEFITKLVNAYGKPITATSANLSGRHPHYQIETLLNELPEEKKKLIDLIIDGGNLPRNKPSTILDLTGPNVRTLRHGDIVFETEKKYESNSPSQTQKLAEFIYHTSLKKLKGKPLVFILKGDLGVGKTVFVKGLALAVGINTIISPTYVIYYEYKMRNSKMFIHADLYNIEDDSEFKTLEFHRYFQPGNILCFEWGEKAGPIIQDLKKNCHVVMIHMKYKDQNTRELIIEE